MRCVCMFPEDLHTHTHQVIINVIAAIIISSNIIALTNVAAFTRGKQKLLILILFFKIPI